MTSATCCCPSPFPPSSLLLIPLLQSSPFPVVGPVVSMSASLSSLVANITSLFSRRTQQTLLLFDVEQVPTTILVPKANLSNCVGRYWTINFLDVLPSIHHSHSCYFFEVNELVPNKNNKSLTGLETGKASLSLICKGYIGIGLE